MNCANHPDAVAAAYCRTCGKPLCPNCVRDVRGVIYCESCLAEKLGVASAEQPAGSPFAPSTTAAPVQPGVYAPVQAPYPPRSGGPNPALAGILAGFFPFGVGSVYCGQYAKGLAHLLVFVSFIWGLSHDIIPVILGPGLGFFYVYQIIDAIRTAHAVQAGQPVPDPFGLGRAFSPIEPRPSDIGVGPGIEPQQQQGKIPVAAVVLIGLGVLFLLQNVGIFSFDFDRIWPFFLIGLGCWLIAVRLGYVGSRRFSTRRSWVGPVVLITIGCLSLLESTGGPGWGRSWPVLLLAIGATRLLEGKTPPASMAPPTASVPPMAPMPPTDVPPPSEVNRG